MGAGSVLNNYQYFIALAEELNISKAAKRLYISHQCLSKYLKNLEQSYGVTFLERSPCLTLTPAGEAYLATLRQIQFLEENLESQLHDIRMSKKGVIRFGTTEGRYRILVPTLLTRFKELYPDVQLVTHYETSSQLCDAVLKNDLDLALLNKQDSKPNLFEIHPLLNENLYLVISDNMLQQYFPDSFPTCKEHFQKGVDLALFQQVPFIMNYPGFNSREVLEAYLEAQEVRLNCVLELTQQDMHYMLSAQDYAASFCWSMYIPSIQQLNQNRSLSHLNIFPINGLTTSNQIVLVTAKGKILPSYGRDLIHLLKNYCSSFAHLKAD